MRNVAVLVLLGACVSEGPIEPAVAADPAAVVSIPRGSTWRYWDRGGDLGSAWRGGFDDTEWATGAGPLGYGEPYLRTTVGSGPSPTARHITTYFRRTFVIDDPAQVTALAAEVMWDDGYVVYLNGVEIERASMPAGAITATTLSTGHEANNAYTRRDWTARRGLLVAGANTLAVEVHQAAAHSSDVVFDLSLAITVELGGFDRATQWYLWDRGGDLGASWRTLEHGDGWAAGDGPLGYGEPYLTTTVGFGPSPTDRHVTTYFRKPFYLDNPSAVTRLLAEVMFDDGYVLYLNGVEVKRAAMPAGPISAATLSTGHEAGDAYLALDLSSRRDLLRAGWNVVGVEVHQAARTSADLVWDMSLQLLGEGRPTPSADALEGIPRRATWRHWYSAQEPSSSDAWTFPGYNDSGWRDGAAPLGYGESYVATTLPFGDPSNKPITAYFRRWFVVDAPSVETTMLAELMYDDGVVVHLNGHEIARLHMPAGAIEHTTRSTGHETGDRYERHDWSAASDHLVPGLNVIAVEVHQAAPTSSDLTFDLALAIETPGVCAIPACGPAVAPPPSASLNGVWVGDAAVWAVGAQGVIGRRTDADADWCWCQPDPDIAYTAVWGSADDDVWIVGAEGRVLHYDGAALDEVDAGTTAPLADVRGTAADDVWIVGAGGVIRHHDGTGWDDRSLPMDQTLEAVWAASAADVWVSGFEPAPYPGDPNFDGTSGVIYRWSPGAGAWINVREQTRFFGFADFSDLDGTSAANVWAIGSDHPAGAACGIADSERWNGADWIETGADDECMHHRAVAVGAPGAEDGAWILGGGEDKDAQRFTGGVWSSIVDPLLEGINDVDHEGAEMWAVGLSFVGSPVHKILRWDGSAWVQDW